MSACWIILSTGADFYAIDFGDCTLHSHICFLNQKEKSRLYNFATCVTRLGQQRALEGFKKKIKKRNYNSAKVYLCNSQTEHSKSYL